MCRIPDLLAIIFSKGWPFCLFALVGLLSCSDSQSPATDRPNIVLIMCDDLGWGDVGFNGSTIIRTDHLDTLAKDGLVLKRFYSASAVCSPTRASCLTGRNPFRLGIPTANAGHLQESETTLPELLNQEGYLTGHFGKWHLGTLTTKIRDANRGRPGDSTHYSIPSMHGYDHWFVTESKVPTYDPMIKPVVFDTTNGESLRYGWKAVEPDQTVENYGTHYWKDVETIENQNLGGDNSEIIIDRVLPFISESVEKQMPFFSCIWFQTPHLPVVADSDFRKMYASYSPAEQLYYGSITAMDHQVGRLVQYLKAQGMYENTMIWFCSDNGPERETPGTSGGLRERKRSLYEGGIRVPAFVTWPKKIGRGETNFPVVTSDYLPTISELLGLQNNITKELDGTSVVTALEASTVRRTEGIGFLYQQKIAWMTHDYKLISTDNGQQYELYDIPKDPYEKNNLADQEKEIVQELKMELDTWMNSIRAEEHSSLK